VRTATNDTWDNEGQYILNTKFAVNTNVSIQVSSGLDIPDGEEWVVVSGVVKNSSYKVPPQSIGLVIEIELEDTKCIPTISSSSYCPLSNPTCRSDESIQQTNYSVQCIAFGKAVYNIEIDTKGLVDVFGDDEAKAAAEYVEATYAIDDVLVLDGNEKGRISSVDIQKSIGSWMLVVGVDDDADCKGGVSYDKKHTECLKNTDQTIRRMRCDNWPSYCALDDAECAKEPCMHGLPDGYDGIQVKQAEGYYDEIWTNDATTTDVDRCGVEYIDEDWIEVGDCVSGEQIKKRKIDLKNNWDDASLIHSYVVQTTDEPTYVSTKNYDSDCRMDYINQKWVGSDATCDPATEQPLVGSNHSNDEIRYKSSTGSSCLCKIMEDSWTDYGCRKSGLHKYSFIIDTHGMDPLQRSVNVDNYMQNTFKNESIVEGMSIHSYDIDESIENLYYISVLVENDAKCRLEDVVEEGIEEMPLMTKITIGVFLFVAILLSFYILSKLGL